jgi:hypothetical protein
VGQVRALGPRSSRADDTRDAQRRRDCPGGSDDDGILCRPCALLRLSHERHRHFIQGLHALPLEELTALGFVSYEPTPTSS